LTIQDWYNSYAISESEYIFLLASLINSIDKYANTASVYGAYLKKLKKSATKEMELSPMPIIDGNANYNVYNEDINKLIRHVSGDILYLDPPYNAPHN
jgi:adenine-specific DNA-methyltransferase